MAEILTVRNLCKNYPAFELHDVSFSIRASSIMGLIGRNGAGKTTTIKSILRLVRPDGGSVEFLGQPVDDDAAALRREAGYVSGDLCYYPRKRLSQLTAVTRSFYSAWDSARYEALLRRFSLDDSKRVCELSAGMKVKYQLACALSHGAKLLILDEPSAALTDIEVEGLFAIMHKLIGEGKSIIFISHKMREVLRISDRITILRLGKIVGTVNRADTDGQKLANMMIGKELTESQYEKIDASGAEVVAELDHVDYNKASKHSGLNDLSLKIHAGEIVGVAGVDGNGQTQLAQLITGVLAPDAGEVHLKGKRVAVFDPNGFIEHGVCHVPEDRNLQGLIGDMSIAENLVLKDADDARFSKGHGLLLKKRAINDYARRMAEKYDVRCTSVSQSVRSLSGGNQQKVILARELENDPALLVMAHPTRGLDIGATSFVHEQMIGARARGVGILLISADFDEILEMSDRIVVCFEGEIMGEFSGKNPPVEEISLAMTGK